MKMNCSFRVVAAAVALASIGACAPKDGAKPADKTPAQTEATETVKPGPTSPATSKELKGLDPSPALSRTDRGNGLIIEDLKMGSGEIVWPSSRVRVHIKGWSVALGEKYWDTTETGVRDLELSKNMKGMQEGIPGMRVGGKRRLHIPTSMAYALREVKNEKGEVVVPMGTPIVLEIEVLEALSKVNTAAPAADASPAKPDAAAAPVAPK
jgi:peptidylprolyl isomerase